MVGLLLHSPPVTHAPTHPKQATTIVRVVWIALFIGCLTMLYQNAHSVLNKYRRNEKIVDIQLKFGTSGKLSICDRKLSLRYRTIPSDNAVQPKSLQGLQDPWGEVGGGHAARLRPSNEQGWHRRQTE